MNRKSSVALLTISMLLGPSVAMAVSPPIELKWDELGSHIQGHEIDLVLPDATALTWKADPLNARTSNSPSSSLRR